MKKTILLADDHEVVRVGLRAILAEDAILEIVGEASTGRQAVELTQSLHPDIIIMDVSMPDMNGIEATRQIKKEHPETLIIILTMHHRRQFVVDLLDSGISGYVLKEDVVKELVTAIHAVLKGGIYLSPGISGIVVSEWLALRPDDKKITKLHILTPREKEVLQLIAEGVNTKQIAQKLHVSTKTIESTRRHIMDKLNLHSVAELTQFAIGEGLASLHY